MKTITKTTMLFIALFFTSTMTSFAQYTNYLRTAELAPYTQIQLNSDVDVILKKSSRNHLSVSGDSLSVFSLEITEKDGILSFDYKRDSEDTLALVVIEYQNLESIVTGGSGVYHFHQLELDKLDIINPKASIVLTGTAGLLRIISKEGNNDITGITADKMMLQVGDNAKLIDKKDEVFFSYLN